MGDIARLKIRGHEFFSEKVDVDRTICHWAQPKLLLTSNISIDTLLYQNFKLIVLCSLM